MSETGTGVRLIFHSDRRVEQERFDVPEPGPRQVLIRVLRSQVSAGTEMNFFRHNPPDGPPAQSYLGYMTSGRVSNVGSEVTEFAPGDRVVSFGLHASHHLITLPDDGSPPVGGNSLFKLDDAISADEAGFIALADVSLHGLRRASPQIDESIAVFGCGIVGQLTIQLARIAGMHPIIAVDIVDERLAEATQSGATHIINSLRTEPVQAIREITTGSGAQTVVHCAPVANLLQTIMESASERGKVIITASAPGTAEIGLQVELMRRELSIIGNYEVGIDHPHGYWPWTRNRNRAACLRLIASGQLRLDHLITHVVPYTEAETMFRTMHQGGSDWLGVVFTWDEIE